MGDEDGSPENELFKTTRQRDRRWLRILLGSLAIIGFNLVLGVTGSYETRHGPYDAGWLGALLLVALLWFMTRSRAK